MRNFYVLAVLSSAIALPASAQSFDESPLRLAVDSRVIDIAAADITSATIDETIYGDPAIYIDLAEGPAEWLATSTEMFIGMPMDLVVCGETVSSPVIQTPIFGGSLQITGGDFGAEWNERIVSVLSGVTTCSGAPAPISGDSVQGTSSLSPSRRR